MEIIYIRSKIRESSAIAYGISNGLQTFVWKLVEITFWWCLAIYRADLRVHLLRVDLWNPTKTFVTHRMGVWVCKKIVTIDRLFVRISENRGFLGQDCENLRFTKDRRGPRVIGKRQWGKFERTRTVRNNWSTERSFHVSHLFKMNGTAGSCFHVLT